jgi:hypothetical protein
MANTYGPEVVIAQDPQDAVKKSMFDLLWCRAVPELVLRASVVVILVTAGEMHKMRQFEIVWRDFYSLDPSCCPRTPPKC